MRVVTELYPHQAEAVRKLSAIKVGALYMEQGTGKTRTALELVRMRMERGRVDCALWLCPCSVRRGLREDIAFHCGGTAPDNIIIRGIESLSSSDALYLRLLELVRRHSVYLVVDESNLVKNRDAVRTERIIEISRGCRYKLILNGTPATKNEADLFAQWYILDWRILGYRSYYSFAANHLEYRRVRLPIGREVVTDKISRVLNVGYLTEKIAPYTYQVLKSQCLRLPGKQYFSRRFGMVPEQAEHYLWAKETYLENVDEIRSETIYKLFTALQHVVSGRRVVTEPDERMATEPIFAHWSENPRVRALERLVREDIGGEKAIVFAKYQSEIDDVAAMLDSLGLSWRLFTGRVPQRERQANRAAFAGDVQFLLANRMCGAYGLNLQFCRNVIYYSNDFDLATRLQSEDRVHRIGQEREVRIFDIYAPDTIDEFIIRCLTRKERMIDAFKEWLERRKREGAKKGRDGRKTA